MICDLHVHTHHSIDSKEKIDAYCRMALQTGVDCLCFTDHVDNNPNDVGLGYYHVEKYFDELNAARKAFGNKLKLLAGIEFAEPHQYQDALMQYASKPYDMIIGSLHFWHRDLFPSDMLAQGIDAETCFESYWPAMRKAVSAGGFDVLGHFDFPKRYYQVLLYEEQTIYEIMEIAVSKHIVLEINTSSLRRGCAETMPGNALLALYREAGGEYVTIGSDAHSPAELAADRTAAEALICRYRFTEVRFEGRCRIPVI